MRYLFVLALALTACGGGTAAPAPVAAIPTPPVQATPPYVETRHFDTVVIGDSLMEHWWYDSRANWPAGAYPAGIGGQTTAQMLARFKTDVLDFTPRVVVIEGGINDLYFNHALDQATITEMGVRAQTAGACVVFVDLLPADLPYDLPAYNVQRKAIAQSYGFKFVASFDALSVNGRLRPELYVGDGIHLNVDGYKVLAPLVTDAIAQCH